MPGKANRTLIVKILSTATLLDAIKVDDLRVPLTLMRNWWTQYNAFHENTER